MSILSPIPATHVDELIAAWRDADAHYGRLDHRWPLVRLVMWPATAVAVVLLAVHSTAVIPGLITLATLVGGCVYVARIRRADKAVARTWTALASYTGLSDDQLVHLVTATDAAPPYVIRVARRDGAATFGILRDQAFEEANVWNAAHLANRLASAADHPELVISYRAGDSENWIAAEPGGVGQTTAG
jgi:hypothetical protein